MNQPPTPLGLQETIAESIYITRPLLHRILPFSMRAPSARGASRGCCGLGPGAGQCLASPAPFAALLGHGTRHTSLSYTLVAGLSTAAVDASPPTLFPWAPSPALGGIGLHLAELCGYAGNHFTAVLVRNLSSFHSLTVCS